MATIHKSRFQEDYSILKTLGSGSFGVVFSSKNKLDGKNYAVKITFLSTPNALKEVENMANLPFHPNIVQYYTCWKDVMEVKNVEELMGVEFPNFSFPNGMKSIELLCIQMELCSENLREWLKRRDTISKSVHSSMSLQLAVGLEHIHYHGIINRDLKPENIFLSLDKKTLKIGDLGLATAIGDGSINFTHTKRTGTPLYKAPEQDTPNYGKEVDVFALGLILFELACPKIQPGRNGDDFQKLASTFKEIKYRSILPAEFKMDCPNLAELVLRMVDFEVRNRADISEVVKHLSQVAMVKSVKGQGNFISKPVMQTNVANPAENHALAAQPAEAANKNPLNRLVGKEKLFQDTPAAAAVAATATINAEATQLILTKPTANRARIARPVVIPTKASTRTKPAMHPAVVCQPITPQTKPMKAGDDVILPNSKQVKHEQIPATELALNAAQGPSPNLPAQVPNTANPVSNYKTKTQNAGTSGKISKQKIIQPSLPGLCQLHMPVTVTKAIDPPITITAKNSPAPQSIRVNSSDGFRKALLSVGAGGSINLTGGTFIGPFDLEKDNITITGFPASIIVSNREKPHSPQLSITGNHCRIMGITFNVFEPTCGLAVKGDQNFVEDVSFSETEQAVSLVLRGNQNVVKNCLEERFLGRITVRGNDNVVDSCKNLADTGTFENYKVPSFYLAGYRNQLINCVCTAEKSLIMICGERNDVKDCENEQGSILIPEKDDDAKECCVRSGTFQSVFMGDKCNKIVRAIVTEKIVIRGENQSIEMCKSPLIGIQKSSKKTTKLCLNDIQEVLYLDDENDMFKYWEM